MPLVIFSHELGNDHTSGERYAKRLAEAGYAAYVFDFCGGTVSGNKSDGSNNTMSILTEASDLEAVLRQRKGVGIRSGIFHRRRHLLTYPLADLKGSRQASRVYRPGTQLHEGGKKRQTKLNNLSNNWHDYCFKITKKEKID